MEQSREWSSALPLHLGVVAIEKGTFESPSTKVANLLQVDACFQFLLPRAFLVQLKILYFSKYEITHNCLQNKKKKMKIVCKIKKTVENYAANMLKTERVSIGKNMDTLVF